MFLSGALYQSARNSDCTLSASRDSRALNSGTSRSAVKARLGSRSDLNFSVIVHPLVCVSYGRFTSLQIPLWRESCLPALVVPLHFPVFSRSGDHFTRIVPRNARDLSPSCGRSITWGFPPTCSPVLLSYKYS